MDYIIETDFQGPGFVAVPNGVAQSSALSPEALGVLVYFASLPRGYILRVGAVRERFNLGKDRWQRIAKELREAGAMTVDARRGEGGRVVGKRVSVRWPEAPTATESRETRPSDRKPEKPTVGKSANRSRETRQSEPGNPAPYKDQRQDKRAARGSSSSLIRKGPARTAAPSIAADGVGVDPLTLSAFQRSRILSDQPVLVGGETVQPGSPCMASLRQALRTEIAEKIGAA